MEQQYILQTLIQIMIAYDLNDDEYGRTNFQPFLRDLLRNHELYETTVAEVIRCVEMLIVEQNERLQFIVDIVREIVDLDSAAVDLSSAEVIALLDRNRDLKVQVTSIKLQIMDLQEQESIRVAQKDYVQAEKFKMELTASQERLTNLILPLLSQQDDATMAATASSSSSSTTAAVRTILQPRRMSTSDTVKCLQTVFYTVCSKTVSSLNPSMCKLYKDFIRRQIETSQATVVDWALKCSITFSMLYEQMATDVFTELNAIFFKSENTNLWCTALVGMFDLIEMYGLDFFEDVADQPESIVDGGGSSSCIGDGAGTFDKSSKATKNKKKATRQLYTATEYLDGTTEEDEREQKRTSKFSKCLFTYNFFFT